VLVAANGDIFAADGYVGGKVARRTERKPWVNRHLPRTPLRASWGAPRRARVPPIDYGDGLAPHLTNRQATLRSQNASNGALSTPRHTDRDRSEWVIGIDESVAAIGRFACKIVPQKRKPPEA